MICLRCLARTAYAYMTYRGKVGGVQLQPIAYCGPCWHEYGPVQPQGC